MHAKPILSVGIDVGTTSTHLTVSRLHLQNISRLSEPSRMVIGQREIIFQGTVHFTPLTAQHSIDAQAVVNILKQEYDAAGITAADVATGAVIVTGESAQKRNAGQLSKELSQLAGDFVVASAGPNLESVLAARGSGAAAASQQTGKVIGNIDIGGGTTNVALYAAGSLIGTGCLSIGGRLLRLSERLELLCLSDSGRLLWQTALGTTAAPGKILDDASIGKVCACAAGLILDFIQGTANQPPPSLVVSEYKPRPGLHVDEWWFSGGIAETMSTCSGLPAAAEASPIAMTGASLFATTGASPIATTCAGAIAATGAGPMVAAGESPLPPAPGASSRTRYGDAGPWLGEALVALLAERKLPFHIPEQPIRATVIGAGMHSLQLSGSTVSIESATLPISNMPVIQPFKEGLPISADDFNSAVAEKIAVALSQQDIDWHHTPVALFIPELPDLTYMEVNAWARALSGAFTILKGQGPLVVICARDVGAALGLAIKKLQNRQACIVLDGITEACGDYIDIGKPIANQQAIPVVIKDLIFS